MSEKFRIHQSPPADACGGCGHVSCFTCGGKDGSEWSVLNEEQLRALDTAKTCNTYRAGQVLFYQGNPCLGIYCVESGEVVLRRADESGNSVVVGLAHPGRTIGYRCFFGNQSHSTSAEALTESRVCFIDREVIRKCLDAEPRLGMRFLKRASEDLQDAEDARIEMATQPIRSRLAHLLLALKDRRGTMGADGVLTIELPISRQDIASYLGARPETIARTVRALEEDGVAFFEGRTVRVPDLDPLLDELESAGID